MVNIDKVLDEMMANSDMSFGEFKQMLAQSAERAYKEKQAREEEKKHSERAAEISKRLCDVANNALNKKLTPEDVTYICQLYAKQEHPEVKDEAWDTLMFADDASKHSQLVGSAIKNRQWGAAVGNAIKVPADIAMGAVSLMPFHRAKPHPQGRV